MTTAPTATRAIRDQAKRDGYFGYSATLPIKVEALAALQTAQDESGRVWTAQERHVYLWYFYYGWIYLRGGR